jgi:hypothetical protein
MSSRATCGRCRGRAGPTDRARSAPSLSRPACSSLPLSCCERWTLTCTVWPLAMGRKWRRGRGLRCCAPWRLTRETAPRESHARSEWRRNALSMRAWPQQTVSGRARCAAGVARSSPRLGGSHHPLPPPTLQWRRRERLALRPEPCVHTGDTCASSHSLLRGMQVPDTHRRGRLRPSRASVRAGSPETTASTGSSSAPVDRTHPCAPLSCMDRSSQPVAAACALMQERQGLRRRSRLRTVVNGRACQGHGIGSLKS